MRVREPVVAGQFYPTSRARCIAEIEQCLPQQMPANLPDPIVAGVVPHAGWSYSGPIAARVYAAIRAATAPQTIVVLSAMHRWGATRPSVYAAGAWATPLGEVAVDADLAGAVLAEGAGLLVDRPDAHADEHSAEVQMPFIQHLFPEAQVVPILMPADEMAVQVGAVIARTIAAARKRVVVVGTTDLTHYGPRFYGFAPAGIGQPALEWARANDRRVIDLMVELRAQEIVAESATHRNACGGGAVAATVAAARQLGAQRGVLLEYTTSHEIMPSGPASDFVGYAALVF